MKDKVAPIITKYWAEEVSNPRAAWVALREGREILAISAGLWWSTVIAVADSGQSIRSAARAAHEAIRRQWTSHPGRRSAEAEGDAALNSPAQSRLLPD